MFVNSNLCMNVLPRCVALDLLFTKTLWVQCFVCWQAKYTCIVPCQGKLCLRPVQFFVNWMNVIKNRTSFPLRRRCKCTMTVAGWQFFVKWHFVWPQIVCDFLQSSRRIRLSGTDVVSSQNHRRMVRYFIPQETYPTHITAMDCSSF